METRALRKNFGGHLDAVAGLDMRVEEGETFGLLGPNGAGKTTIVRMLVTLLRPTSGGASVGGFDIVKEKPKVRKVVGYLPQQLTSDDMLTGYENIQFYAKLYGLQRRLREIRIAEALSLVGLGEASNKMVKTYSGGMKRRLELASVLVCRPRILFLDEPSLGLDPRSRNLVWDFIRKLHESFEVTILLTTNYMDEAERLCDRVAIVDVGKVVVEGGLSQLKELVGGDVVTLKTNSQARIAEMLRGHPSVRQIEELEDETKIVLRGTGEAAIPSFITDLGNKGVEVTSVTLQKPSLDDVFTTYTGRTLKQESPMTAPQSVRYRAKMQRREGR